MPTLQRDRSGRSLGAIGVVETGRSRVIAGRSQQLKQVDRGSCSLRGRSDHCGAIGVVIAA